MNSKKFVAMIAFIILGNVLLGDLTYEQIGFFFENKTLTAQEFYDKLQSYNDFSDDVVRGEIISEKTVSERPFLYYFPQTYSSETAIPLVVWLHGGVNRPEYIEGVEYAGETGLLKYAEEMGFALLFPLAKDDCVWWSETGEANILEQIRFLKTSYNIDDDKVYLSGFSDGGSGSFHFGFKLPDTFAGIYPLNGMISVSAYETGNPSYIPNLENRYLRVVNTDEDGLYPAERTRLTMDLAISAGANINYREYWGYGHDWGYFGEDMPLMLNDMIKRSRDMFHSKIYWETYCSEYGSCDWLEITEIDTTAAKAEWQKEYNVQLPDTRISFGFYHDEEFKGEGVEIKEVIEGSLAEEMGLQKEDVIFMMDEEEVLNIEDLSRLKSEKHRGEEVSLNILRHGEIELIEGAFPDTMYYSTFFYNRKSGAVKGYYCGNVFTLQTSQVKEFKIKIHPDMVNMDIPVKVIVNGVKRYDGKIEYDRDVIRESILKTRDRKGGKVNEIVIRES